MTKQKKQQQRYGIFYRSNGRVTGPYRGWTFTKYSASRNPIKQEIKDIKNYVLKTRVGVLPVSE
jgi:hypothetical protein